MDIELLSTTIDDSDISLEEVLSQNSLQGSLIKKATLLDLACILVTAGWRDHITGPDTPINGVTAADIRRFLS